MSLSEFEATPWFCGMTARYHGDERTYKIAATDFGEYLIGLKGMVQGAEDEVSWVRCENCTLVNHGAPLGKLFSMN